MPRAGAPLWKQLSGDDLRPFIQASMRLCGPDENGHYGTAVIAKLNDFCGHIPTGSDVKSECWIEKNESRKCEIHEVIRQLYNGARRENVSLPWPAIVKADDGTWQVHFYVSTKTAGRKTIVERANGDRANLAYDPTFTTKKKRK